MRIILAADAPWAMTANAVQMGELARRLMDDLHTVFWMPTAGFSGGGSIDWNGVKVLPGDDSMGNDILPLHVQMNAAHLVISRGWAEHWNFGGSAYAWWAWNPGTITRKILRKANKVIGVSEEAGRQLEEKSGVLPVVIPRAAATAYTDTRKDLISPARFRKNHRIPEDAFLLSVIGRSDPNWTRMLDAYRVFHEQHENTILYMHTDITGPVDLLAYAEEIGLPMDSYRVPDGYNLHMGYYNEAVAAMYRASDIHLVPNVSVHPIIESMTSGTPVIATEHPESAEVMTIPGLGALIPPVTWQQGYPLLDVAGWVENMNLARAMEPAAMAAHRACVLMSANLRDWDSVYAKHWRPLLETFQQEEDERRELTAFKGSLKDKRDTKFLEDLGFVEEFGVEVIRKTDIGGAVEDEHAQNEAVKSWGDHPNVIKILRDGRDKNDRYFFETEKFTELGDMSDFTPAQGDKILAGIRAGLDFMHSHGAAHCDINPRNILMKKDGTPVIFDFDFMQTDLDPQIAHLCDFDPLNQLALPYAVPIMASGIATRGFHRVVTFVRNLPYEESHATAKPDMPYQKIDGVGERDCAERWALFTPDVAGKRVLDLGTNLGYFASRALDEGATSVLAVDRDEAILRAARVVHPELNGNAIQLDLNDGLPEGEFDVAFCLSIWQHLRAGKRPLLDFLKTIPVVYWEDANLTKPELERMGFTVTRFPSSERGRNLFRLESPVLVPA